MERAMSYACYCLASETGRTYVGFSTNLERRLRQHNQELVGGAKATTGLIWKRILSVVGFPSQQAALQFEWKWKHLTRSSKEATAVERRCEALVKLLNSESSTSNAALFYTYEGPLTVFVEDARCYTLRDKELRYGIILE